MKQACVVVLFLAACSAPPTKSGPDLVTVNGRRMLQIPAGEFEMAGQLFYLPAFLIDYEPGPAAPGLVEADEAHLIRAEDKRYGLPERSGTRFVLLPPPDPRPGVEWRSDFWAAIEEARRRNTIVFITLNWDGCGNCDRYQSKIAHQPKYIEYVNEHVVPIVGTLNHDSMDPHASLPDGRCWIFPTMTCAEHRLTWAWGIDAMMYFPMSPGHAILTPRVGLSPRRDEFVLIGDEKLPDEGTVDFWIETFQKYQGQLGDAVRRGAYLKLKKEFEGADEATLKKIADDDSAPFRDDARLALEGDPEPGKVDAAETLIREERWVPALDLLQDVKGARAQRARLQIERIAWHHLCRARMESAESRPEGAGPWLEKLLSDFDGTEAARQARKEEESK